MSVANDGKWKSFQNGQILYGPAGVGQNLNTDLQGNLANEVDSIVADIIGDGVVGSGSLLVTSGAGLSVNVAAGTGYATGQRCVAVSPTTVPGLPDNTSGIKIYFNALAPWSVANKAWAIQLNFTTGALTAGQVLLSVVATSGGSISSTVDNRSLIGVSGFVKKSGDTMIGPLLFSPDNTTDIGAAGATRPRTLYLGTSVQVGTNPAASGAVRLANAGQVVGRNQPNNADIALIGCDSSSRVFIGDASSVYIRMGGQVRCDLDANSRLVVPVGTNKYAV